MSNVRSENVYIIDTSGALSDTVTIRSIKFVAGTGAASCSVKSGGSSGTVVWTAATTADAQETYNAEVWIHLPAGDSPYISVSGTGAKAYLYLT
jgi:hypothetical protein